VTGGGSYRPGDFAGHEAELERLVRQAAAGAAVEEPLWRRAGLQAGRRVLDAACGPGLISAELARVAGPGRAVGLDLNARLIREAEEYRRRRGVANLDFLRGDVYDLPFSSGSFDFVYARFLFQHLTEPGRAVAELGRVLDRGGVLAVFDVDDDWLAVYPDQEAFQSFKHRAAAAQADNGGDRFVGRKLPGLMLAGGLTDVRVEVRVVTSFELGMTTWLDLAVRRLEQIPEEDRPAAEEELRQIYALGRRPDAWGAAGVFFATGARP